MAIQGTQLLLAISAHLFGFIICQNDTEPLNVQLNLWNDLMAKYDKSLKPQTYALQQLNVEVEPMVSLVEGLDEKDQVLSTCGGLVMNWTDFSLTWNPRNYRDVDRLIVDGNKIWKPEIIVLNGVESVADISFKDDSRVRIFYNGQVVWKPLFKWKTACTVNLRYFPYHEQTCSIIISNVMYGSAELNFTMSSSDTDDNRSFPSNGEWDLVSKTIRRKEDLNSGDGTGFCKPSMEIKLVLRRKPTYFVLNLVLPSLFMTVVSLIVFCLPPASGEKISLGITNLLSYSVMILMVTEVTPRTSDTVPVITVYIIIGMGLSALGLFATALVLALFHKCPEKSVPEWMRFFILNGLGTLLCMTPSNPDKHLDAGKITWAKKVSPMKQSDEIRAPGTKDGKASLKEIALHKEVVELTKSLFNEKKEIEEQNKKDWEKTAQILDRFFLCTYVFVILVSTVWLLVVWQV